MRKMFSVLHYEYKMQFKRLVTWGVLLVATALSLLDNFPLCWKFSSVGVFE